MTPPAAPLHPCPFPVISAGAGLVTRAPFSRLHRISSDSCHVHGIDQQLWAPADPKNGAFSAVSFHRHASLAPFSAVSEVAVAAVFHTCRSVRCHQHAATFRRLHHRFFRLGLVPLFDTWHTLFRVHGRFRIGLLGEDMTFCCTLKTIHDAFVGQSHFST